MYIALVYRYKRIFFIGYVDMYIIYISFPLHSDENMYRWSFNVYSRWICTCMRIWYISNHVDVLASRKPSTAEVLVCYTSYSYSWWWHMLQESHTRPEDAMYATKHWCPPLNDSGKQFWNIIISFWILFHGFQRVSSMYSMKTISISIEPTCRLLSGFLKGFILCRPRCFRRFSNSWIVPWLPVVWNHLYIEPCAPGSVQEERETEGLLRLKQTPRLARELCWIL